MSNPINRRTAVSILAASATTPLWSTTTTPGATTSADAAALKILDQTARHLLQLFPESATSLGVDRGADARLRSRLTDRSAAGQRAVAARLRQDLAKVQTIDLAPLSHAVRTSVDVVRSAYSTALEGLALPYGDVAVGGWRNTPYVVIQNVGAYLDVPRFLDSDHQIDSPLDAHAYVERLRSYPRQLDGELERLRAARETGLVPPAFLIDKALAQLRLSAKNANEGGTLVESLVRRTKNIPGDWDREARAIASRDVVAALSASDRRTRAGEKIGDG